MVVDFLHAHKRLLPSKGRRIIFFDKILNMKISKQSSISLESSWHKECNGLDKNEWKSWIFEQACSKVSEHSRKWAGIPQGRFSPLSERVSCKRIGFAQNESNLLMIEQICSKMSEYVHVYATFLNIWRILVDCLCTKCSGNSFALHLHFIFTVHPRVTGVVSWSVHLSALVQKRMSKRSVFGQRSRRGRSLVEHWGTFVCSSVR